MSNQFTFSLHATFPNLFHFPYIDTMKFYNLFTLAFIALFGFNSQCTKKDQKSSSDTCISFDQRQCGYDEWSEMVPISDNVETRAQKMKSYLSEKDIQALDIKIEVGFHEFTCEACGTCPEADRFFIHISKEDVSKLEPLDLLNQEEVNCADVF